jgi:regulator of cell morphogenesis and NO signaling
MIPYFCSVHADKNLQALLEENLSYASILHWCGIDAFDYLDATLSEVCRLKNLDANRVIEQLNLSRESRELNPNLSPATLCSHLQSTHHHYAQKMLPVIEHHISTTAVSCRHKYPELLLLGNIFAAFKKDFLLHIEYENTRVFPYIRKLEKHTLWFSNNILLDLKDFSIETYILKHHHDDDEMFQIRRLLRNYAHTKDDSLPYRVLMAELKSFENDLKEHSYMEEHVLVPAARKLEAALRKRVQEVCSLN